ncbi:tRNA pseudouridine synthase A [Diachasma alloeum]|uniref:tRNA pseudouridine synthase A n=1 Tax=Diachasma alloeum TaxID=454923 RepID=UPI0007383142|nr:tRNA pseudouridine synthase A [Diachasma alloeum]
MLRLLRTCRINSILPSFVKNRSAMSTQTELNAAPSEAVPDSNKRPLEEQVDNSEIKKKKFDRIKKKNFAFMLGYLGKDYYGMQRNPNMRTIEEDLITAMFKAKLIDEEAFETIQYTNFQRAARTDKGVSATRQICSAKLPDYANIDDINQFLPKEIRVFGIKRVTKGFNSKSQCNARTYTYTLPTFAFAPDDTTLMDRGPPTEEELAKRVEELKIIDGKPYTEFRMSPELREKVNSVLKLFEGTHNFHNFTSRVRAFDPRANRYMMKCQILETHISKDNIEFATLQVKGQSFMLHQIRKMVALTISIVRNLATEEAVEESFKPDKWDIPIAPGLGLVLNHVHYDNYNKRYGADGIHEQLEWSDCEEAVQKFHNEFILPHIEETELKEQSMLLWLGDLAMHKIGPHDEDEENNKQKQDDDEDADINE